MAITSCCGCFSLRTGAVIYAVIDLVGEILGLVFLSIGAIRLESAYNTIVDNRDPQPPDVIPLTYAVEEVVDPTYYIFRSLIFGIIIYLITLLIVTVLFITGICNKKPSCLLPYICVGFTHLMISIAIIITNGLSFYKNWYYYLIAGLELALTTYRWLVIFHFYKKTIAEKFGHAYGNDGKIYQPSPRNQV